MALFILYLLLKKTISDLLTFSSQIPQDMNVGCMWRIGYIERTFTFVYLEQKERLYCIKIQFFFCLKNLLCKSHVNNNFFLNTDTCVFFSFFYSVYQGFHVNIKILCLMEIIQLLLNLLSYIIKSNWDLMKYYYCRVQDHISIKTDRMGGMDNMSCLIYIFI